jgi:tripartite-type tricarboxylate transporter receptor subunit TctC
MTIERRQNMTHRRTLLQWPAALLPLTFPWACSPAHAQTRKYPDKPIRFVVPFAAGGGGDTMARFLAQRLYDRVGQTIVVENKVGAGGNLGSDFVLKSAPDGYTLLNMSSTYPIQAAVSKLPYDPIEDLQPIALISRDPAMVIVGAGSPLKTLNDLIAAARKDPGKLTYGSAGVGSIAHLGMEELAFILGIKLTHVPYKGSSQAFNDVISNQIDMMLTSATFGAPFIKSNRVIGLGVAGNQRVTTLPDMPTFAELGYPSYQVFDWKALAGPKGIPPQVVAFLNAEVNAILADKATSGKFEADGTRMVGGSPEQMMAQIKADIERWKRVVEKAGVKVE